MGSTLPLIGSVTRHTRLEDRRGFRERGKSILDNWAAFLTGSRGQEFIRDPESPTSQFFHLSRVINFVKPTNRVTGILIEQDGSIAKPQCGKLAELQVFSIASMLNKSADHSSPVFRRGETGTVAVFFYVVPRLYRGERLKARVNFENLRTRLRTRETAESRGECFRLSFHSAPFPRPLSGHSRRNSMPEVSLGRLIFPSSDL